MSVYITKHNLCTADGSCDTLGLAEKYSVGDESYYSIEVLSKLDTDLNIVEWFNTYTMKYIRTSPAINIKSSGS